MPSVRVLFGEEEIMKVNLTKDVYTVGRQEECDIHIDNLGISRTHARFIRDGDGYAVEDLGSSNGTFVNANQVQQRQALNEGDIVTIGKYELTYSATAMAEAEGEQGAAPPERESSMDAMFDGAVNTMAMDGDAMRKRMEEMRAQARAEGRSADTVPVPAPEAPAGATAPAPSAADANRGKPRDDTPHTDQTAEIRARDAELAMLKKDMAKTRTMMIVFAILAVAAIVAALLLKGG